MNTDDYNPRYCHGCLYLSLKEVDQVGDNKGMPHLCLRYDCRVSHGDYAPNLPRVRSCLNGDGKYVPVGPIINWLKSGKKKDR